MSIEPPSLTTLIKHMRSKDWVDMRVVRGKAKFVLPDPMTFTSIP